MPISIDCRQTLPDDCPTYFDRETRLLEAPMVIRVADQVSYLSPFVTALKMIQKAFSCGCCCFELTVNVFV